MAEELPEWRGNAIPLEEEQVHDVTDSLHRQYIDAEAEVEFKRRGYAGEQSEDSKRFRVVGVRDEDADYYELYITNMSREEFLPDELATVYSCRWETEILLRELKT
jgi:IS4 transposase